MSRRPEGQPRRRTRREHLTKFPVRAHEMRGSAPWNDFPTSFNRWKRSESRKKIDAGTECGVIGVSCSPTSGGLTAGSKSKGVFIAYGWSQFQVSLTTAISRANWKDSTRNSHPPRTGKTRLVKLEPLWPWDLHLNFQNDAWNGNQNGAAFYSSIPHETKKSLQKGHVLRNKKN